MRCVAGLAEQREHSPVIYFLACPRHRRGLGSPGSAGIQPHVARQRAACLAFRVRNACGSSRKVSSTCRRESVGAGVRAAATQGEATGGMEHHPKPGPPTPAGPAGCVTCGYAF